MSPSRRKLIPLLPLALVTALLAAACGSGSDDAKTVPPGAIALVGDRPIPKQDLDRLMERTRLQYEAQKQEFPQAGTPAYDAIRSKYIRGLVQQARWELAAAAMGLEVADDEINSQLASLKERYFKGDDEAYKDELEKQGYTEEELRSDIRAKLLSDKLYAAVIKKATVTEAEIKDYYDTHKVQYQQPESREVRHILVSKKSLADELHAKIENGADFAELAKKYSEDTVSAADGGKYTAYKGKSVAPFDEFVFDAETGELSEPIKTQYGWHVIEVLGDIKPPGTQPLQDVSESIRATLLQEKQSKVLEDWVAEMERTYEVVYAPGYAPAPTTTQAATTGSTTG
jgi:parvulin-like peptidyl-prolyl isomerase